jgi:phosphatidylserine decarboxylase
MSHKLQATVAAQRLIRRTFVWWLCGGLGGLLAVWQPSLFPLLAGVVAALWLLFALFAAYFFRDPTPVVPQAREAIVSPAHGLVDEVDETTETEFMGGLCRRVSIFLSVFDVHVQNAPVSGRVTLLRHQPGEFLNAMRTDSARHNENQLIGIESLEAPGERIAVRQIAGFIARRVVAWVQAGDAVARGQRLGLIQFGSRCDLYLPLSTRITVKPGEKVVGGETVVATRTLLGPRHSPISAAAHSE